MDTPGSPFPAEAESLDGVTEADGPPLAIDA